MAKSQNIWGKLFDSFLDLTEFSLIKYEDGFGLEDHQGANLGDIEDDRFETAEQIFERMSIYIDDYIDEERLFHRKGVTMKNKTNISALEELVNSEIRIYKKNCDKIDNDILEQNIWMTIESYYEDDKIPTKEELEYLDRLELAYDKLGRYDEEYDKALEHAKEMEEFYSNLGKKLKEVL